MDEVVRTTTSQAWSVLALQNAGDTIFIVKSYATLLFTLSKAENENVRLHTA